MVSSNDDLIQCPGRSYLIARYICWARQEEGDRRCRKCPEQGRQLYLFGSPYQVERKVKSRQGSRGGQKAQGSSPPAEEGLPGEQAKAV